MRLIHSELFRCARFFVVIFHVISCHLPSFARRRTLKHEETSTYGVRIEAVFTTSMNANRRHRQTRIRYSSRSRRAKLLKYIAPRSRGGNKKHSRYVGKFSRTRMTVRKSNDQFMFILFTSYERTFWCAVAERPSSTWQVLHKQERTSVQGTGAPNTKTRDNHG